MGAFLIELINRFENRALEGTLIGFSKLQDLAPLQGHDHSFRAADPFTRPSTRAAAYNQASSGADSAAML